MVWRAPLPPLLPFIDFNEQVRELINHYFPDMWEHLTSCFHSQEIPLLLHPRPVYRWLCDENQNIYGKSQRETLLVAVEESLVHGPLSLVGGVAPQQEEENSPRRAKDEQRISIPN